jgi:hypothetical protein
LQRSCEHKGIEAEVNGTVTCANAQEDPRASVDQNPDGLVIIDGGLLGQFVLVGGTQDGL